MGLQLTGAAADIYAAALFVFSARAVPANQAALLASFMVAQSKHETANYTSNVFKVNHNAFGYKVYQGSDYQISSGVRSPEGNAYGNYSIAADSAKEVAAWIYRRWSVFKNVSTLYEYCAALKTYSYFTASLSVYYNGCNSFFSSAVGVPSLSGVLSTEKPSSPSNDAKIALSVGGGCLALFVIYSLLK